MQASVDPHLYAGIYLGVINLAALTSNKPGPVPIMVNGRPVKLSNQFYTKRLAFPRKQFQTFQETTWHLLYLMLGRNWHIEHSLHMPGRFPVNVLVLTTDAWSRRISTVRIIALPEGAPDAFGTEGIVDFLVERSG